MGNLITNKNKVKVVTPSVNTKMLCIKILIVSGATPLTIFLFSILSPSEIESYLQYMECHEKSE
jgi:hypothetical protein